MFGGLTVFAPNNAAFAKAQSYVELLFFDGGSVYSIHIGSIVDNHYSGLTLSAGALQFTPFFLTTEGETLTFDQDINGDLVVIPFSAGVEAFADQDVQDAVAVEEDIFAENGVIHIVDEVLFPVWYYTNLFTGPDLEGGFSSLIVAVEVAGLANTLRGLSNATLLAPNDAAFANIDPDLADRITNNPDDLSVVLRYHILPEVLNFRIRPAFDDVDGILIQTVQGEEVFVSGTTPIVPTRLSFNENPNLGVTLVREGLFYELDTILTPPSFDGIGTFVRNSVGGIGVPIEGPSDEDESLFAQITDTAIPLSNGENEGDRVGNAGVAVPIEPVATTQSIGLSNPKIPSSTLRSDEPSGL